MAANTCAAADSVTLVESATTVGETAVRLLSVSR
jgi:hypothetical protein